MLAADVPFDKHPSQTSTATTSSEQRDSDRGPDTAHTTVILRQVPRDITRQAVVQALADQGFGADVDFLYCPLDYVSKKGFGYVLLNFASAAAALRFRERFQGLPASWLSSQNSNCLDIVWAKGDNRQGLQANLDRYRNSPVMHSIVPDEFKPVAMCRGRRVAFAKATEKLEAPSKLPRSVWKAWTEEKKRLAGKAPEKVVSCGARAAPPADISLPAVSTTARRCWDHRLGLVFTLAPGFRGPPGLPLPAHLQLL
jgi:hypothetical protein